MYVSAIGIQPRLDTYILLHHYTAPDMSQNDKVPENGDVRSLDCLLPSRSILLVSILLILMPWGEDPTRATG